MKDLMWLIQPLTDVVLALAGTSLFAHFVSYFWEAKQRKRLSTKLENERQESKRAFEMIGLQKHIAGDSLPAPAQQATPHTKPRERAKQATLADFHKWMDNE